MQPLWSDLKGLRTNRNRSDKTGKTAKTETVLENVAKRNARNKDTEIISLKSMAAALKNRTKWPNVSGPQMNPILACRPGSKHGKSNSFARTELRPKRRLKWFENADAKRINGVRERKKVEKFPFWQQQRTRTYFPIKKFTVFFSVSRFFLLLLQWYTNYSFPLYVTFVCDYLIAIDMLIFWQIKRFLHILLAIFFCENEWMALVSTKLSCRGKFFCQTEKNLSLWTKKNTSKGPHRGFFVYNSKQLK